MADYITDLYNQYLGRSPDTAGYDYWTNILNNQGQDAVKAGITGSSEAQGKQGGGGGYEVPTDVFSTSQSQSGLPDWGNAWAKDWLKSQNYQSNQAGLSEALQGLKNAPSLIEQTRQNMVNQYRNAMNYNLNETMKPKISNLAARGVLSSSTAEGTLGKVLQDLQAKYSDQVTNADTWASNALLQNLKDLVSGYQTATTSQGGVLGTILNAIRQSSASSQDPWQPYATMLPLLMSM